MMSMGTYKCSNEVFGIAHGVVSINESISKKPLGLSKMDDGSCLIWELDLVSGEVDSDVMRLNCSRMSKSGEAGRAG